MKKRGFTPVVTYKRIEKDKQRVFEIDELDGFYVDNEFDRTVHITFEEEDVFVIDIYDTVDAAYDPVGEAIGIIKVNIRTGESEIIEQDDN